MSKWLDHSSIVGHLGGYVDKALNPISWATGGKWTHLTSDILPEKVNSGLSAVMRPFDKIDQTINPVRKIPIVDRVSNIVAAKPGDAAALVAGAYFGGGALLGGAAAGAAGEGTAMGGAAGTLGAADSAAASSGLGLTAADVGEMGAAGEGAADVGGLAAADSAAVDAEGAEPGLTQGYGHAAAKAPMSRFRPMQQQQEEERRKLEQLPLMAEPTLADREAALMQPSSRKLKERPAMVSMQALAHAGASGADQVSQNGVHIGAIRALHTKISALEAEAHRRGIKV